MKTDVTIHLHVLADWHITARKSQNFASCRHTASRGPQGTGSPRHPCPSFLSGTGWAGPGRTCRRLCPRGAAGRSSCRVPSTASVTTRLSGTSVQRNRPWGMCTPPCARLVLAGPFRESLGRKWLGCRAGFASPDKLRQRLRSSPYVRGQGTHAQLRNKEGPRASADRLATSFRCLICRVVFSL